MPHSLHSGSGPDHDSDAVFLDPLVQAATFQNPIICILVFRFSLLLPPFLDHPVSLYCFIPILTILWSSYWYLRIFLFAKFVSGIMSGLEVMSLHRKLAYSCFIAITFLPVNPITSKANLESKGLFWFIWKINEDLTCWFKCLMN